MQCTLVVTASQNAEFGRVVREADIGNADGAPVAWICVSWVCWAAAHQWPDLMWKYCEKFQRLDPRLRGDDGGVFFTAVQRKRWLY